jgi:CBS domain-containing protein
MSAMTARDLMNSRVLAVRDDWSLSALCAFLTEHQIHGAPVVDSHGRYIGAVSVTDVVEECAQGHELDWVQAETAREIGDDDAPGEPGGDELTRLSIRGDEPAVRDLMTPTLFSVPPETPIESLAGAMIAGRVHRLFVVERGQVLGIVTSLDLLKALVPEASRRHPGREATGS